MYDATLTDKTLATGQPGYLLHLLLNLPTSPSARYIHKITTY